MSTPEEYRDDAMKRRGRGRKKLAERQYVADLTKLMSEPWGRRLMWTWLERAGIYHSSFSTHSGEMSFKEGKRSAGLQLLSEVVAIAPTEYDEMTRENRKARGADEQPEPDTDE